MADISPNQWKLATIGLLIVGATVLITSLVIGRDAKVVPPDKMVQAQETDTQVVQKEPVRKPKAAVKIAAAPPPPKTCLCGPYAITTCVSRPTTNASLTIHRASMQQVCI